MPATNPEQTHHRAAHQAAPRSSPPVYVAPKMPVALTLFPTVFLGACVLIAALIARFRKRQPVALAPRYAARGLLSDSELHFWQTLRTTVGSRAHVSMKVRQADILKVEQGGKAAFNSISQKHVDFLLCHPETLKPLVAVELDDRSHQQPAGQKRDRDVDEFFKSAGLPIVHVPVTGRYDSRELEALLGRHLPTSPTQALTNRPGL